MRFCWILYVFYGIANVFANSHNAESTMLQYKNDILQTYPDSNIIYDSQNQHIEKKEESSSKITQQPYIPHSQNMANYYSILYDLRNAFEIYSVRSIHYTNFLKHFAQTTITDNTTFPSYHEYLTKFLPQYPNMISYINSFDEGLTKKDFYPMLQQNHIDTKTTSLDDKYSSDETDTIPLQQSYIDIATLSPKCVGKKFNLRKDEKLSSKIILNMLAKDCDFSIQYNQNPALKRKTEETFGNLDIINIQQKGLDFILNILLDDIFYEIQPHRLLLKDHNMQIFEINYVSSTRMAQSNTDVLFSQEQHQGYGGLSSGLYGGGYGNYGFNLYQPNLQANPFMNSYNQQFSSYLDGMSLKNQLRNQMNYNNNQFGKSGTKIYSIDEINFWVDIESRLNVLLDSKVGDRFMIDKVAGLISVWTTKNKMKEVSLFLQNLQSKMNLQVAIDVEILSLTHFSSTNVGIDWQEIFRILNPTQSAFNAVFGNGGSIFTLGNNSTDLRSIINLLKTYGDLRSLSNPKIMALNNQPAIISVGSVLRYSQNLVFQSNNTNNTIQNTSTQYPSVFAGILLDITPSISKDEVILRINPSITKTKDPELENTPQALTSPPNLSTNQLSSIVKLKDGQRVIIGGLINNVSQSTTQAIPKIGETRGLKRIFGKESKTQRNEELIIIITPHIIR